MTDLSTRYLGLKLNTPLVVSASPLSQELYGIRRLEDAGASAIVLYSLFEEQLRQEARELEYHLSAGTESFAESLTYLPMRGEFHTGHHRTEGRVERFDIECACHATKLSKPSLTRQTSRGFEILQARSAGLTSRCSRRIS